MRNSANFATANPLVCGLYGGINFQIEHHLFPTLSHVHYATVQPIIREACKEFDIPYIDYPSVASAYASALRATHAMRCLLADGLCFAMYRSLVGLLEHLRCITRLPRRTMHGLYTPHGADGEGRDGPSAIVRTSLLMALQGDRRRPCWAAG